MKNVAAKLFLQRAQSLDGARHSCRFNVRIAGAQEISSPLAVCALKWSHIRDRAPLKGHVVAFSFLLALLLVVSGCAHFSSAKFEPPKQFIVFNLGGNSPKKDFAAVSEMFTNVAPSPVGIGVAGIFSYFAAPPAQVEGDLKNFLRLAEQYEIPVVVQLDGEAWWDARPDLWNWWDASRPGFNPSNRFNVEWSGWQPTDAMRIAWRNWGSITRVLPPPNLMSPAYRAAWRKEMQRLVPVVVAWQKNLPADKRWLLIGVKVGWESSIGVNAWYYPDGNKLADLPHSSDPTNNVQAKFTPARGVAQIGYASVKTAGLRREGEITEADLAEIVRRHLEDMCRTAAELGVRREKLFTHVGGWKDDELLYGAATNVFSCPGWSFYRHADDARQDTGVQSVLAQSDAKYWAAVEWSQRGKNEFEPWRSALANTLADPRCRFLCIYNWGNVQRNRTAQAAVRRVIADAQAAAKN